MGKISKLILIRLLPVLFITASAIAYVRQIEGPESYAMRNAAPMIVLIVLSALTLYRGSGSWIGAGRSVPWVSRFRHSDYPCICTTGIRSISTTCSAMRQIRRHFSVFCQYIRSSPAPSDLRSGGLLAAMFEVASCDLVRLQILSGLLVFYHR